jgi:hypothetical protein
MVHGYVRDLQLNWMESFSGWRHPVVFLVALVYLRPGSLFTGQSTPAGAPSGGRGYATKYPPQELRVLVCLAMFDHAA